MGAQDRGEEAWTFEAESPVERLAVASSGQLVLVADRALNCTALEGSGAVSARFRIGKRPRRLRIHPRADCLTVLAGEQIVYAFTADGEMDWRVELNGPVADFDLDASARNVVAVSPQGWFCVYSPATHMQATEQLQTPCSSVAVAAREPLRSVAASNEGVVVMLDGEGAVQWRRELGCRTGAVAAAPGAGLLAVPAYRQGTVVFDLDGTEVTRLRAGHGRARRAEMAADPLRLAVEGQDGSLRVLLEDSSLLWETDLGGPGRPWALGDEGRLLVVAQESVVHAYRLSGSSETRPAEGEEEGPAGEQVGEFRGVEQALDAGERAMSSRRHKTPRVMWKKRLPLSGLPVEPELFRLTTDGRHLAFVLQSARLVVLDSGGEQLLRADTELPVHLAPRMPEQFLVAWSARQARALELDSQTQWTVGFSSGAVTALAAARQSPFFCTLGEDGRLRAWSSEAEPDWERALTEQPDALLVSPGGDRVLVSDTAGRFQFFDRRGRLVRKFRFGEEGQAALALGDGFTVFGGPEGRLTILDGSGSQIFSRKLSLKLKRVELLESAVAVYGQSEACALVSPTEGEVRDFRPPPGRVRLRRPRGCGPMIVHVDERTISVLSGYRRQLSVVWRHDFGGRIGAFQTDRWARAIAVLAAGKIHRLEPHSSEGGAG